MLQQPSATILNVEASRPDRCQVAHVLRQAGFAVRQADSGAQALGLARERPDLILLDVDLPDMSGFDVCRQIKRSRVTARIPVLYRFPLRTPGDIMKPKLEGGADGYLVEPIERVELLTTVRALLRMRQAEEAAHQWQSLFDALGEGVGLLDGDGTVLRANAALGRLLGRPVGELVGLSYRQLVPGEPPPAPPMEFLHSGRWLRREVVPTPAPHNQLLVVREITARKRADDERDRFCRAQEEQTAHLRRLLEATQEGILSLDRGGRFTYVNPAAARMLNHEEEGLLGKDFHNVVQHSQADGAPLSAEHAPIQRALQSGTSCRVDNEVFWRADGTALPVEYLVMPLADGTQVYGAVVSFRDVGEQRRLEERFRQSQKMEPMGRLASGVTHDFNNLLTIISGYSEILLERLGHDDPSRELILEIQHAQDRAAALTRQLLAFSRKQPAHVQRLDLNTVIIDVSKLLCRLIGEDVEVVTCPGADLGIIRADLGQIEQVLLNLAVNARDAMPDGGSFTIETSNVTLEESHARAHPEARPGPYVLLSVADSGCGMNAEVLAHLFEPFFTTKEPGKGTGLGLCTVAGIIKQAGGHIRVFSEQGRGTTFKIYFPRAATTEQPRADHSRNGTSHAGGETILFVEDDPALCELVERILTGKGYTILHAPCAAAAREVVKSHSGPVHLLLCDVGLAQAEHHALAELLQEQHPAAKTLFFSGYPGGLILHPGESETDAAILPKPFSTEALTRKVREVLGG